MSTRARLLAGAAVLSAAAGSATGQTPAPLPKAAAVQADPLMPRTLPPVLPPIGAIPAVPVSRQPDAKPVQTPPVKTVQPPAAPAPQMAPPAAPGHAMPAAPMVVTPPVAGCGPDGCGPAACAPPAQPEYDPWAKLRGPECPSFWASYNQGLLWFQPSPVGVPIAVGGRAGQPQRVLLGNGDREMGQYNTFGFDSGMWLDDHSVHGAGVGGFITEHRALTETVTGTGAADGLGINRPFTSLVSNLQGVTSALPSAVTVAGPGTQGSISLDTTARFASIFANYQKLVAHCDDYTVTTFFGFRYFDLDESLTVRQRTVLSANPAINGVPGGPVPGGIIGGVVVPAGTAVRLTDRFRTRNQMYAGEAGARVELHRGRGFLAVVPRVAFGPNHQVLEVTGETRAGATVRVPGGLLAAGAGPANGNLGRFTDTRFALATDIGVEGGASVTHWLRVKAGYHFFYLNNVVRPGSQFDAVVNTRVVPISQAFGSVSGPVAPRVTFDREGFYAHGVMLSVEFLY